MRELTASIVALPCLGLLAFALLQALPSSTTAAPADAADAAPAPERRIDLVLQSFVDSRKGSNMSIYARERAGKWVSAVVSSAVPGSKPVKYTFNMSYHSVDLSRAPLVDGKWKGPITITINPDNWVPSKHLSFTVDVELDATIEANGTASGSWKLVKVNTDDPSGKVFGQEGKITGTARPYTPAPLPNEITFNLQMGGALVGGSPAFGDRTLLLKLGFKDGILVSAIHGTISQAHAEAGLTAVPVENVTASYDADRVQGKATIVTTSLDAEPCTYVVEFDGGVMEGINCGLYKLTAKVGDAAPVERSGAFDGRWATGVKIMATNDQPWWAPVKGFQPVQAGEHPRLLFRRTEIAALRERAKTPEGQAVIKRLKAQLGGGEAMPTVWSNSPAAYAYKGKPLPLGAYTIGHATGFGLLYQLTGEKKYADLALECFEWAFKGIRDADDRYAWVKPGGSLRAGVVIGWYALGYDLACDGWDEATRLRIGKAIAEYNAGREEGDAKQVMDVETLIRGTQPPGSNHYGMQVGGAAMALLAVMGDPGVDSARIDRLLKVGENSMVRNLTEGFGDGGFFSEGDGTGSMASHIIFLTTLKCWKAAKGMDWGSVQRPNARMMALRWIYQTIAANGRPDFWPIRGAYGHNVWDRKGMSGAGYFAEGFGILPDEQKAAMLWYYNHFFAEADTKAGMPFDSASENPQYTVCGFVNWPFGISEKNPAEVLPLCFRDTRFDFFLWRNRWQDNNDIVITILPKVAPGGNYAAKAEAGLSIAAFGKKAEGWAPGITGDVKSWWTSPKGETSVLTMANGTCLAVDFTQASGVEAMLVVAGKAAGKEIVLGGKTLTVKFLTGGAEPDIKVEADKASVGTQSISLDKDGKIVLGVTAK